MRRLLKKFEDRVDLPIEIDELRDAVIALGVQDQVVFSSEDIDTSKLKGAFYRWREHARPYSEPRWTTLIVYPSSLDLASQRAICAKELVHVCDLQVVQTATAEAVLELAEKVVDPHVAHVEGIADLMAAVDKIAAYQGLNILFPKAARDLARRKLAEGSVTLEEVADWALVPIDAARLLLSEEWESIATVIEQFGG